MSNESKNANTRTISQPTPVELRGEILVAECTDPLPPGSRVDLLFGADDVDGADGAAKPLCVSGKIVSVNKGSEGFRITVRLSSIAKEDSARLAALFSA